MSSSEITRACDADRERFIEHVSRLYAQGYLSEAEAEGLRQQILDARSLTVLESALHGFPQPGNPQAGKTQAGKDWSVPESFVPACIAAAVTGVLVAVVPATALAHRNDSLSNVLAAATLVIGIAIFITAVIVACSAACRWDDIGAFERERRRAARKRR